MVGNIHEVLLETNASMHGHEKKLVLRCMAEPTLGKEAREDNVVPGDDAELIRERTRGKPVEGDQWSRKV